eukprot:scpid41764/ scgid24401/ 
MPARSVCVCVCACSRACTMDMLQPFRTDRSSLDSVEHSTECPWTMQCVELTPQNCRQDILCVADRTHSMWCMRKDSSLGALHRHMYTTCPCSLDQGSLGFVTCTVWTHSTVPTCTTLAYHRPMTPGKHRDSRHRIGMKDCSKVDVLV